MEESKFEISYRPAKDQWISPALIREKMVRALGYGVAVEITGTLSVKSQQGLLKLTESNRVDVKLTTSKRVSRELEARAWRVTGKCGAAVDPRMIGLYRLDPRAALEFSKVVGNVMFAGGGGLDLEDVGAEGGDEFVAEVGDDMG